MDEWKKQIKLLKEIETEALEFDESIRVEVFKCLLANAVAPAAPRALSVTSRPASASVNVRELAPQELIRRCGVSSLTDKALVLAYWLEVHQNRPAFTSTELKDAFSKAREPAPTNPSDVVGRLEAAGKLMKSDASGKTQAYKLTSTGIAEVEKWSVGAPQESLETK